MKIIFESDEKCHGRLIFDTDWTFAMKVLDMIWKDMTIYPFNERIEEENREQFKKITPVKKPKR